jgi:hypothetical protein
MLVLATFLFSSRNDPSVWALFGACAGVYLFYRGFRLLQRKRLILDTPTSKVHSAAIGLVEVSGLAVGPYTLTAPVTTRACYYYRTIAWQWKQSGKNKRWVQVAEESMHLPFFLDDNTGKLLVNPQGAELDVHCDFREEFSGPFLGGSPDVPGNVAAFLTRHGVSNDRKLKVEEYCIKPKNSLYILGTLAQNPGIEVTATPVRTISIGSHSFNLKLSSGLSPLFSTALKKESLVSVSRTVSVTPLAGSLTPQASAEIAAKVSSLELSQQGKIAAALTKAGIANPAAWAAAGIQYPGVNAAPAVQAAASTADFDPRPPVVLMKGTNNPAFFISWRSQKEIVLSLGWKSAAMIWGGPALTLLCVYILAAHFGWL